MSNLPSRESSLLVIVLLIAILVNNQSCYAHKAVAVATETPAQTKDSNDKKAKGDVSASNTPTTGAPCISWVNPVVPPKVALLCIHGLGLYSGSYTDFGTSLMPSGIATFAIDVRGFGSWMKDKGEQDLDFDSCLDDIKAAVTSIHTAYPNLPVFLLGESMGGAIALRFASLHPEMIDGLISSVPAGDRFKQKRTDVSVALSLIKHPNKEIDIGNKIVNQATQNPALREEWTSDPLDRMDLSAKQLIHFQHFMNENHDSAKQITSLPVLFVQGTQDKLVKPEGTWELFNQLATPHKVFLAVPSEHLIFEDTQTEEETAKARNVRMVTAWIFANMANSSKSPDQIQQADLSAAITKLVMGQYSDAQHAFEQLAAVQPMSSEVNYWLGVAYLKNNQAQLARRQFVRSIALGRGSSTARQANNYLLSIAKGMPRGKRATDRSSDISEVTGKPSSIASAMAGGKPAVLAFYATWCEQCNRLDGLFKHGASMFGNRIKFLKIDVDDPNNQNLVKDFKVGPIPTLIYLKKDGTIASTSIGESGFANFADGLTALVRN